jgi:hypothetical protein
MRVKGPSQLHQERLNWPFAKKLDFLLDEAVRDQIKGWSLESIRARFEIPYRPDLDDHYSVDYQGQRVVLEENETLVLLGNQFIFSRKMSELYDCVWEDIKLSMKIVSDALWSQDAHIAGIFMLGEFPVISWDEMRDYITGHMLRDGTRAPPKASFRVIRGGAKSEPQNLSKILLNRFGDQEKIPFVLQMFSRSLSDSRYGYRTHFLIDRNLERFREGLKMDTLMLVNLRISCTGIMQEYKCHASFTESLFSSPYTHRLSRLLSRQ